MLATSVSGEPILVAQDYGKGRVLAFAGDSTWRWARSTPESQSKHGRFWRQMVVWLARAELAGGTVFVRPEERDLFLGSELGFRVGVRSKGERRAARRRLRGRGADARQAGAAR